jgi:hypothetical protein
MAILGYQRNVKHSVRAMLLSGVMLAVAFSGVSQSTKGAHPSKHATTIEGTWVFTVHRVQSNVTFTAFQSFAAGGVTTAIGTVDRTPPPPISPLIGSWKPLGGGLYGATLCFFIYDTDGHALHMFKNYMTIAVNDDDIAEGAGDADICDPDGSNCVVVPDQIVFSGRRLVAQGTRL